MGGLSHRDLCSPRLLCNFCLTKSIDQYWAIDMAPFPRGTSQPLHCRSIILDPFCPGGGVIHLPWNWHVILTQMYLLCTQCFCQHQHPWTHLKHYPLWRCSVQHCFWQPHFTTKVSCGGLMPMELICLTACVLTKMRLSWWTGGRMVLCVTGCRAQYVVLLSCGQNIRIWKSRS